MLLKLKGNKKKEEKKIMKVSKFSKLEIVFTIRVFRNSAKGGEHTLDVQLNRGHVLLFLEYINRFIAVLAI